MTRLTEAIQETYRRIEANKANPVFIHLVPEDQALERAAAVERTPKVSPLWGQPFVLKDNIDAAGMPKEAVERLQRELAAILKRPEIHEQFGKLAFAPRSSTPEELSAFLKQQIDTWTSIAKEVGIKPE